MVLGFIGAGNMAGAIIEGVSKGGAMGMSLMHVYDIEMGKVAQMRDALGSRMCDSCEELIRTSDVILLGIKPYQIEALLWAHHGLWENKAIISIAAGWTVEMLTRAVPKSTRVMRVMPNTPALVGEGMTVLSRDTTFTKEE